MAERWRTRLRALLDEVVAFAPPVVEVDLDALADMFTALIEGAFIVSRILEEPDVTAAQIEHFRTYVELLFPVPA